MYTHYTGSTPHDQDLHRTDTIRTYTARSGPTLHPHDQDLHRTIRTYTALLRSGPTLHHYDQDLYRTRTIRTYTARSGPTPHLHDQDLHRTCMIMNYTTPTWPEPTPQAQPSTQLQSLTSFLTWKNLTGDLKVKERNNSTTGALCLKLNVTVNCKHIIGIYSHNYGILDRFYGNQNWYRIERFAAYNNYVKNQKLTKCLHCSNIYPTYAVID